MNISDQKEIQRKAWEVFMEQLREIRRCERDLPACESRKRELMGMRLMLQGLMGWQFANNLYNFCCSSELRESESSDSVETNN